jgi:hypothetical protein
MRIVITTGFRIAVDFGTNCLSDIVEMKRVEELPTMNRVRGFGRLG